MPISNGSGGHCNRKAERNPLLDWVLYLWLVALIIGCSPKEARPLPEQVRAELGTIGLTAAPLPPEIHITAIPSGRIKGAAQGAGAAVVSSVHGCLDIDPTGICAVGALVLSPYIATGGAIYGAVAVRSEKDIVAARRFIEAAIAEQDFRLPVLERVYGTVQRRAKGHRVVLLPRPAPPLAGAASDRLSLSERGIDSLLEMRIAAVTLGRRPAVDPQLQLHMKLQARLIRTRDNSELYTGEFTYRSEESHGFVQWGEQNAARLRFALKRGLQRLADKIVEQVFLLTVSLNAAARGDVSTRNSVSF